MLKRLLFAAALLWAFVAQATVYPLPWGPRPQFIDQNGAPMSAGTVSFFAAGSTTPQNTYTDSTGTVANTNPITLNTRGETTTEVWLTGGQTYKTVLKDSSGVTVWTVDNIAGINDISVASTQSEWVSGPTPTYVSGTSFTLAGDQTPTFTINRRMKFTVSAGTVYGRILTSTFGALTTLTLQMDGAQALDSGLSSASYAMLAANALSVPTRSATAAGTDTYTATVGIARLVINDEYLIKIPNANATTTPTLNLDSTGAKTIVKDASAALAAGDMAAGGQYIFRYDGTNMVLLNPKIQLTAPTTVPVRQTVLSGPVDGSGLPSFGGSTGTTTVTVAGTLIATNANGFSATGPVDNVASIVNPSWTGLSTNGTMYLYMTYAAGVWTTAATTIAPVYQWGGTPSVTNGTLTFSIQAMTGFLGNGATAPQTNWVLVGEVTVAAGSVTAITWYQLMGRYESAEQTITSGTNTTISHNLGIVPKVAQGVLRNKISELGYAVGQEVAGLAVGYGIAGNLGIYAGTVSGGFVMNNTGTITLPSQNGTVGSAVNITNADWKIVIRWSRGW